MTGLLFEPPPIVGQEIDDDGYVRMTQEEWDLLMTWLERLTQFISDKYD